MRAFSSVTTRSKQRCFSSNGSQNRPFMLTKTIYTRSVYLPKLHMPPNLAKRPAMAAQRPDEEVFPQPAATNAGDLAVEMGGAFRFRLEAVEFADAVADVEEARGVGEAVLSEENVEEESSANGGRMELIYVETRQI